jgi:hypothetical protein
MYDGEDRSRREADEAQRGGPDMCAFALASFKSEDSGNLTFERGDKIKVRMQHKSGGWKEELSGNSRLFPDVFTMIEGKANSKTEVIGAVFPVMAEDFPLENLKRARMLPDVQARVCVRSGSFGPSPGYRATFLSSVIC